MIFDAHTHLNFEKYTDEERAALAAEIEASELGYIIDVADCVKSAEQALRDAETYDWCYAAVGIHPDHASSFTEADIEEIKADIAERDYRDMHREISPLAQAEDAVLVDSSDMTIDEVIAKLIELFNGKTK